MYRVFWIPQIPMEPFHVPVDTIAEGRWLVDVLANYDLFQLRHNIKPDYCNVGGVQILKEGEWCDIEADDT